VKKKDREISQGLKRESLWDQMMGGNNEKNVTDYLHSGLYGKRKGRRKKEKRKVGQDNRARSGRWRKGGGDQVLPAEGQRQTRKNRQ